ncbi:MAG TPA: hypothetical protein DEF51_10675 [Myxococcales bacterium]|nr:hypothetical protein [Myxococcales bacterium]
MGEVDSNKENVMNFKQIGIGLLFLDFAAFTGYTIYQEGALGLAEAVTSSWWAGQITLDLCICAFFGCLWVWRDAKKRGLNPLPYVIAVPFTGSLALLVYAIRRQSAPSSAPLGQPAHA